MRTACLILLLLSGPALVSCRAASLAPPVPPPAPSPPALLASAPARMLAKPLAVLPWGLAFLLCGLVGAAIGENKGRRPAGFFFGLLAGPVGWALVAAGPDLRPRCRSCRSPVPRGAARCPHCAADLAEK